MTPRELYLLDQYQRGQLSADEREEFDKLASVNAEFQEMSQLADDVSAVYRASENDNFRKSLQSWESSNSPSANKSTAPRKYIWWLLGLVALALVAYLFYSKVIDKPTPQEKVQYYAVAYPNISTQTFRSSDNTSALSRAFEAYNEKKYDEALRLFENVPAAERTPATTFYTAMCHYLLDDNALATAGFQSSFESEKFKIPSTYYLFLLAVEADDAEESRRLYDILQQQRTHPKLLTWSQEIWNK